MTILYVDTSAVLKRVVNEAESTAVTVALRERADAADLVIASSLAWLEVWRSLRRLRHGDVETGTRRAMSGVDVFPLDARVLEAARGVGDDSLRSLDAIHLVSAVMAGAHAMLTFDSRLADAARSSGIEVLDL